jgi:hypothetical protein
MARNKLAQTAARLGTSRVQTREAGNYVDQITMRLGPFSIEVEGSEVTPPLPREIRSTCH